MSVEVELFNGAVKCRSYCELLKACGSRRKDSLYIRSFGSPEDMVRKLMPMFNSDEELIRALNSNLDRMRLGRGGLVFKTPVTGESDEVFKFIHEALVSYCNSGALDTSSLSDHACQDINTLVLSSPEKIKSFLWAIGRHTKQA